MNQIIELNESDVINKLITEFYDSVAMALKANVENAQYDCRKVCISSYIQDCIYESYRKRYPEEYLSNKIQFEAEVTMRLAMAGPKVLAELKPYQVLVEEGFLC